MKTRVKGILSTCGSRGIQLILCMTFVMYLAGVGHALTYTSSWVGNTYGTFTNHILQDVLGMFVDANGKTYCITNWDEGGTNVQVFNTDGSLNGKVYESGTGSWDRMSGIAVCGDSTYIYQAESQGTAAGTGGTNAYGGPEYPDAGSGWQCIRRYNISSGWGAPWTGGAGFDGSFLIVNTNDRDIKGIAHYNNELYVAEGTSNLIKVYNASTMSNTVVRSWSVSDPGQLYFDGAGYIWMFQPIFKRLVRYNTSGVLQSQSITFGEGVVPTGFGIDRVNHKIYVANNGVDQNILVYSNITSSSPTLSSTFGTTGGIYSGVPGQVAPLKFNWPHGVGVDNNGNIYVASSPALALGSTMVEKYDSSGTRQWAVYGLEFVDCAGASPVSENDVYTKEEHFTMDYSQPAGQQWSYTGYTLNRFKYPNDPRLHTSHDGTFVRDFAGKRFLYMTDMYAGQLMVYRFDYANDGECAIPCGIFTKAPMGSGDWPPNEPRSGEYIWCDADGDGTMDSTEYHQPETTNTPNGIGWYVDDGGNVWFAENGAIRRYAMCGLDAYGTPKYSYSNMTTYSIPAPFDELRRVIYQTSTDTLFLSGYSSTYTNDNHTDEWKGVGRLLCCYKNWMNNGNRTANWQVVLPDCSTHDNLTISLDVAGNYLFAVTVPEIITVYRTSDGSNMGTISPTEYGFVGWVDITNGISALQRSTGSDYLIFQEEDFSAKVIMYQWNDGSAAKVNTPVITPSAGTYDSPQSVLIRCSTTGATIRYTTDGTEPTSTSPVYNGAINVSSAMTLKAKAFKSGSANSDTSTAVYTFKCQRPTFSPVGGIYSGAQSVTISIATSGSTIRYTTDGTTPSSSVGTIYTGPITISANMTLKAIAYKSGINNSDVTSQDYFIRCAAPNFSPASGTYTSSQTVTISSSTSGATIRYTTDGTTPTASVGAVYTGPFTVSSTRIVKAIAYKSGMYDSSISTGSYIINASGGVLIGTSDYLSTDGIATEVNLTQEGTSDWAHWGYYSGTAYDHKSTGGSQISNFTVIGNGTPGAVNWGSIWSTWTDGTPNDSVTKTSTCVCQSQSTSGDGYRITVPADTTLRTLKLYVGLFCTAGQLRATLSDGSASAYTNTDIENSSAYRDGVFTLVYRAASAGQTLTVEWTTVSDNGYLSISGATLQSSSDTPACSTPTFSPVAGTYTSAQSVAISTATNGASIRYTTDGTDPTPTTGTLYSSPVSISSTTTLKAIAYMNGYTDSAVTSGTYTITTGVTNIAPTGVGYRWSANSSATANTNKVAASGLNDGNDAVDVMLNGGTNNDIENAWEAAGITWSTPKSNITSVTFTNGSWTVDYNGAFSANLRLQVTTDGSTWTDTGWTFSPNYAYDTSAVAGVKYTFAGSALNNVLGVRITGQVHTTYLYSYEAYVREVEVFTEGSGTVAAPTFSPVAGTYTSAQTVTISTTTSEASIRYTTDGSVPTSTTGTLYNGPVSISSTCTLKAIAYLSGWTNSTVTSGVYTISGSLSGSVGTASGTINLTTQGTSDWAHWGYRNSNSFIHKSSGGSQISNFTQVGGTSAVRYTDCAVGYTWTDGTPTTSATATTTGVYINQPSGNGFSFTVPADTTPRTVKVYCGIWHSAGTLTATLSDGSATSYTNTQSALNSVTNAEYTINYTAGSAGQTLTITWLCANNSGNVTLQAATLTGGGS